jgi:hypothetical protein
MVLDLRLCLTADARSTPAHTLTILAGTQSEFEGFLFAMACNRKTGRDAFPFLAA